MSEIRPLVLVTNDDSIEAPGLFKLVECLPQDVDIIVVAPAQPQSGKSSAITVNSPLRISSHPDVGAARVFTVSGTPVDCVKLALHAIVPRRPALVLAGINHGSNSGCNVIYSGTMGAVMEGCTVGIPSCGFSLLHHSMAADFDLSLPFVRDIISGLLADGLPDGVCLNVNIPAKVTPRGVRACRAAHGYWTDEYQRFTDPSGKPFYWLTGKFVNSEPLATDTDEYWLGQEYISLVPVSVDMSATSQVEPMSKRFDK
ncbi:MAG: 5'/3'-nucleotidase SurE [Muribaculaceae bacterium]|nr:5'/3'-nucleotidase SurE [Muribaculaceae bacterium]